MSPLQVELNRSGHRTIEAPAEFTASGPFSVVFDNGGESVRAHLRPDDSLEEVLTVDDRSPLVESGAESSVHVSVVDVDEPVTGTLTIGVGYGAEERTVSVTVSPYPEGKEPVDVDESLARPRETGEEGSVLPDGVAEDPSTLGLVAFAGVAVLVALGLVATVRSPAVLLGSLVVLGAVVAAVLWALR